MDKDDVLEVLKHVYDPDYRNKSIVEMGLIDPEDIKIKGNSVEISYNVTAPMCPFGAAIGIMIKYALEKKLGIKAQVRMKKGNFQEDAVNEVLTDESELKALLDKLESYGMLEQCVRLE